MGRGDGGAGRRLTALTLALLLAASGALADTASVHFHVRLEEKDAPLTAFLNDMEGTVTLALAGAEYDAQVTVSRGNRLFSSASAHVWGDRHTLMAVSPLLGGETLKFNLLGLLAFANKAQWHLSEPFPLLALCLPISTVIAFEKPVAAFSTMLEEESLTGERFARYLDELEQLCYTDAQLAAWLSAVDNAVDAELAWTLLEDLSEWCGAAGSTPLPVEVSSNGYSMAFNGLARTGAFSLRLKEEQERFDLALCLGGEEAPLVELSVQWRGSLLRETPFRLEARLSGNAVNRDLTGMESGCAEAAIVQEGEMLRLSGSRGRPLGEIDWRVTQEKDTVAFPLAQGWAEGGTDLFSLSDDSLPAFAGRVILPLLQGGWGFALSLPAPTRDWLLQKAEELGLWNGIEK